LSGDNDRVLPLAHHALLKEPPVDADLDRLARITFRQDLVRHADDAMFDGQGATPDRSATREEMARLDAGVLRRD
jgi:hypothetical protein